MNARIQYLINKYAATNDRDELRKLDESYQEEIGILSQMEGSGDISSADSLRLSELRELTEYMRQPEPRLTAPGQPGTVEGFRSLGEQLQCVINSALPGGRTDARLYDNRATGLTGSQPSEGGFLLQTDYSEQLIGSIFTGDGLPGRVRRFPIRKEAASLKIQHSLNHPILAVFRLFFQSNRNLIASKVLAQTF